jgi:hypothetical protein
MQQSVTGVRKKALPFVMSAFAALAALAPSVAKAEQPRLTLDWGRMLQVGSFYLARESEPQKFLHPRVPELAHPVDSPELGSALFGVAPNVSLVARDWGSAKSLAGGPIALTDAMRVSRSCRMVLSRIRLGVGRVVPFAQLGIGQWRVDQDIVPHLPRSVEVAGQVGGGVELHLVKGIELAVETDLTVLFREGMREPQQVVAPHLWGTFLAARFEY